MSTFGLGYIPDEPDERDRPLAAALIPPAIAASGTVWDDRANVKNQGATSSCVGNAVSQAIRLGYMRHGAACPELSARACYRAALTLDGSTADHGTYLRSGVRGAQKIGIPDESAWPFDAAHILAPLTFAAAHSAYDRRGVRGYYRIASGDVDGICAAIAHGFPVVAGWQVGPAFQRYTGTGLVDVEGSSIGGHALCLHSYDADGSFRGVNSWGTGWGRGGHFAATERWVASATDVWALDVGGAS